MASVRPKTGDIASAEVIRIGDEYYLLASALAPRRPHLALVDGETFAVVDCAGDVPVAGDDPYGLFHRGTRYLSRFELRVDGNFPVLLTSSYDDGDCALVTYLSNADRHQAGRIVLPRNAISIRREKVVREGQLSERLELRSFAGGPLQLTIQFIFAADFVDVFELRGVERRRRGRMLPPEVHSDRVVLPYLGLDGKERRTELRVAGREFRLAPGSAQFTLSLGPQEGDFIEIDVACEERGSAASEPVLAHEKAYGEVQMRRREFRDRFARIQSNHEHFNEWLDRSLGDLALLWTSDGHGQWGFTQAGIPWFATLFGRDALLTAFLVLAFAPEVAEHTLRRLAAVQGREIVPERDEEPGKIVHEMRSGELAATGEIPFARYYGSVDSTPLFVLLVAEHARRVGCFDLARELWPAVVAAVGWMEEYGDIDGDGYIEYRRRAERGLINQGWKDSHDAVMHQDGALSAAPIALAEVQAYAYGAWSGAAWLARKLGHGEQAERWAEHARRLQRSFARDYWMADRECLALALDGEKRPCRVVSSNAGQCLLTGILDGPRAARLVRRLFRDDLFCGWGIRTLSASEVRFNPMSYHNGSVWPHDNALIAAGCARYGYTGAARQLLAALFEASGGTERRRLPELFCGFARDGHAQPVPYPVACRPQAWAAASVFGLLQAALGMVVDGVERRVAFAHTELPEWLSALEIRNLRLGDATVDLDIVRGRWGAAVEVIDKRGEVEVVVRK